MCVVRQTNLYEGNKEESNEAKKEKKKLRKR